MGRGLGASVGRVDRRMLAVNYIAVEGIFGVRNSVGCTEETLSVRVVFGEEELRLSFGCGVTNEAIFA